MDKADYKFDVILFKTNVGPEARRASLEGPGNTCMRKGNDDDGWHHPGQEAVTVCFP